MTRTPLIAANWKMNGRRDWADKPRALADRIGDVEGVDVLICPAFVHIALLETAPGIALGAQTCHPEAGGAQTGEISAEMLADLGCRFVLVGHSERRARGETDADVRARAEAAHRAGLVPIVCVGETLEQREAGAAEDVVLGQIMGSRPGTVGEFAVAYEPVWAIGTGRVAEPADIAAMHAVIRGEVGPDTRILYGGSVKPANASAILALDDVDGALVGGASLDMEAFAQIVRAAVPPADLPVP